MIRIQSIRGHLGAAAPSTSWTTWAKLAAGAAAAAAAVLILADVTRCSRLRARYDRRTRSGDPDAWSDLYAAQGDSCAWAGRR